MATTDLKLEECGNLPKPGPIGQFARLAFGMLCLNYVYGLWQMEGDLLTATGAVRSLLWNGMLIGLFLISYVINIGFSRDWGKRPAFASALLLLAIAGYGYLTTGAAETLWLAQSIYVWELYIFTHLGTAFALAAFMATPGCEMRAFHHLYSKISGNPTKEHHCPVGPLGPIDRWEAAKFPP